MKCLAKNLAWTVLTYGVVLGVGIVLGVNLAHAHNGGNDRYGGHLDKETGLYHCHVEQAPPAKMDLCKIIAKGRNFDILMRKHGEFVAAAGRQVKQAEDRAHRLAIKLETVDREKHAALAASVKSRRQASQMRARYNSFMDAAKRDRDEAATIRAEADAILASAKERALGAGPSARFDCREVLEYLVLDARKGWFTGDISVTEAGQRRIRDICF